MALPKFYPFKKSANIYRLSYNVFGKSLEQQNSLKVQAFIKIIFFSQKKKNKKKLVLRINELLQHFGWSSHVHSIDCII